MFQRAVAALRHNQAALDDATIEYGRCDRSYAFAETHNPDLIKGEFTNQALLRLQVNLVLILDRSNGILFSKAIHLQDGKDADVPPKIEQLAGARNILTDHKDAASKVGGIVSVPEGAMLVSSRRSCRRRGKAQSGGRSYWAGLWMLP